MSTCRSVSRLLTYMLHANIIMLHVLIDIIYLERKKQKYATIMNV